MNPAKDFLLPFHHSTRPLYPSALTSNSQVHQLPAISWQNHRVEMKEIEEGFWRLRVICSLLLFLHGKYKDLKKRKKLFQVTQQNAGRASTTNKAFGLPAQCSLITSILMEWESWDGQDQGRWQGGFLTSSFIYLIVQTIWVLFWDNSGIRYIRHGKNLWV